MSASATNGLVPAGRPGFTRKILLIGPSGVGKSHCIKALEGQFPSLDMDRRINTRMVYGPDDLNVLYNFLRRHPSRIVAVSVVTPFLTRLLEEKARLTWTDFFSKVIYLRSSSPAAHHQRLRRVPSVGMQRSDAEVALIMKFADRVDGICARLADVVVDVDEIGESAVVNAVEQIVTRLVQDEKERQPAMPEFLTRQEYDAKTSAIGGAHWASAGSRWAYHELAVTWASQLALPSASSVLEMGPMGVQIVNGSHSVDYDASKNNKDWLLQEYKPTYVHDARILPWPFKHKQYELLIALRVFHHLVPKQQECFREAKRIAKAMILVVPSAKIHPRGIDREQLVQWNGGIEPEKERHFSGDLGSCYLFRWE